MCAWFVGDVNDNFSERDGEGEGRRNGQECRGNTRFRGYNTAADWREYACRKKLGLCDIA